MSDPEVNVTSLRFPLTPTEEMILDAERFGKNMNLSLEIAVSERIAPETFADALAVAIDNHPMAAVKIVDGQGRDRRPYWQRDVIDPWQIFQKFEVSNERFPIERDTFFSRPISTSVAPLVRVALFSLPSGDRLFFVANHVVCDGGGLLAFVRSVSRAYRPQLHPETQAALPVDEIGRRWTFLEESERLNAVDGGGGRIVRAVSAGWRLAAAVRPARIARSANSREHGDSTSGISQRTISRELTRRLRAAATDGASLNDVIIAATHIAVEKWNADLGCKSGKVNIGMPITVRSRDERVRMMANLTLQSSVWTGESDRSDLMTTLRVVRDQTALAKASPPGLNALLLAAVRWMPSRLRLESLKAASWLTGDRALSSSRVSNLGRIETEDFAGIGLVSLWFTPPVRMPQGAVIGVSVVLNEIYLSLSWCRAQFDRDSAGRFADVLVEQLENFGSGTPGPEIVE